MRKNAVFDYGKVIVPFEPEDILRHYTEDPRLIRELTALIFPQGVWEEQDLGELTPAQFAVRFIGKTADENIPLILEVAATWWKHAVFLPGMEELLLFLRQKGIGTYLLSNISRTFCELKSWYPHYRLFDGVVLSSEIHITKPDPRIYQYLLNRYALQAADCIFIDDRQQNLEPAKELGFATYLFNGDAQKLKRELIRYFAIEEGNTP